MSAFLQRIRTLSRDRLALLALSLQRKVEEQARRDAEPVAIVGIGCRFPGGADNPDALWQALDEGRDLMGEVPHDRWDHGALYHPEPGVPGKVYTRHGAFIQGWSPDDFDAAFFGISPREAAEMDPQQRILLNVAWEALEDAGIAPSTLEGSRTGVYVGLLNFDHSLNLVDTAGPGAIDSYTGTGTALSFAAGRLSYVLGVRGPSIDLGTACSSSLVSLHLATQALRTRECSTAIAAGVQLMLSPRPYVSMCQLRALAPDGRCRTFDADASGYGRGEGCAVVVLKRLSDAVKAGDRIYALVRGSAVNHDGASGGLTVPSGPAQEQVIAAALEDARLQPADVQYVEAHGTGTPLGDPIELRALHKVYGKGRTAPLIVGSIKTNMGHTEAAAGLAGVIKATLAMRAARVPPHLHFQTPNPRIQWDELQIEVPAAGREWPAAERRRAGISSFGLNGTNAHVVLEEYTGAESPTPPASTEEGGARLLPLSARSGEALYELADRWAKWVDQVPLDDAVFTAARRRAHLSHRMAVVVEDGAGAATRLTAFAEAREPVDRAVLHPRVVFVCPGQGGQWHGMDTELRKLPGFSDAFEAAAEACSPFLDRPLLQVLSEPSWLERIDYIQPALFAVTVGLSAAWAKAGVRPDAVVGHSMGEVAAAHLAGILSLEDAARVICTRSALMMQIRGRGAMAVVELDSAAAESLLAERGSDASVAVVNSPRSSVLSGSVDDLEALVAELTEQGVFARMVQVDVASHSAQVEGLLEPLRQRLSGLQPQPAQVSLYSTVLARAAEHHELDAHYWGLNLRRPVRFWETLQGLCGDGHNLYVELGPHPMQLPSVRDALGTLGQAGAVVGSARRREDAQRGFLDAVGQLWSAGADVDWDAVHPTGAHRLGSPAYPWQGTRFPLRYDSDGMQAAGGCRASDSLLGYPSWPADRPDRCIWTRSLDTGSEGWWRDHKVAGSALLPGAAHISAAVDAARSLFGQDAVVVREIELLAPLPLPEETTIELQCIATQEGQRWRFEVFGRASEDADWSRLSTATLHRGEDPAPAPRTVPQQGRMLDPDELGTVFSARQLDYGEAFSGLRRLWVNGDEVGAELELPKAAPPSSGAVHPALLDAAMQGLIGTDLDGTGTWVPTGIERVAAWGRVPTQVRVWARTLETSGGRRSALQVIDGASAVQLEIDGFVAEQIDAAQAGPESGWSMHLSWEPVDLDGDEESQDSALGSWLVAGPGASELAGALEAAGGSARAIEAHPTDIDGWTAQLLAATASGPLNGVVYTGALSVPSGLDPRAAQAADVHCGEAPLALVHALVRHVSRTPPRLWMVAADCQHVLPEDEVDAPARAALWGLCASLVHEHPELGATVVDLSHSTGLVGLVDALRAAPDEDRLAERAGRWFAPRLVGHAAAPPPPQRGAGDHPFTLTQPQPGDLGRLEYVASPVPQPGPGEVRIQVDAAALNFRDVLLALGALPAEADDGLPGPALGRECAGTVDAVGAGVDLAVGTPVVATTSRCLARHVLAPAHAVAPRKEGSDPIRAAARPLALLTAWFGLVHLGRIQPGDRVLVHSAAGGVGSAAVLVARQLGAEVFATAGSEEKRDYLRGLGIQHVYDSRSLDFGPSIRADTGGEGIDVVLNSLGGAAIDVGLELLRSGGRFVELGMRDYIAGRPLPSRPFTRGISLHLLDLRRILQAGRFRALIAEIEAAFGGQLPDLRVHQVVPACDASEAFRLMARAEHIGRVVVDLRDRAGVHIRDPGMASPPVRADGTYVIIGGLGGIGRELARWLATRGAGHVVLVGRSVPPAVPADLSAGLATTGTQIHLRAADVGREADIEALASSLSELPPVRGLVHAAAVLADGTILRQTPTTWRRATVPKILGMAHLLAHLPLDTLDFLLMYSSAAGVMGSPGQSNYAAANMAVDALAWHLRARGVPATSLAWGPWAEVGAAQRDTARGERLEMRGATPITPELGIALTEALTRGVQPWVLLLQLRLRQWRQYYPRAAALPLVRHLADAGESKSSSDLVGRLQATPAGERLALLEGWICGRVAHVLRLDSGGVRPDVPFKDLGVDSLMSLEIRNQLEGGLGLTLSSTLLWTYPNARFLAGHLLPQLLPDEEPEVVEEAVVSEADLELEEEESLLSELADLDEDELAALLAEDEGEDS